MERVTDGRPLKDYPTTFNTPASNNNKLLLQTAINKEITLGYKIYSQQSSTSSSASSRQSIKNRQHQKYEYTGLPLIAGIHIPDKIARIYLDEKNRFNMEVNVMIYQALMRRRIIFSHTTTMPLMKSI